MPDALLWRWGMNHKSAKAESRTRNQSQKATDGVLVDHGIGIGILFQQPVGKMLIPKLLRNLEMAPVLV